MRITQAQLRRLIREELQREFMSSRRLKLADFGGDLPPEEPPGPDPERGGGSSGIKSWIVSPIEMRLKGGVGTEMTGGWIVGRSTLDQFLSKWGVRGGDAKNVKMRVDSVLAKIAASAFEDLEDDEDEDDFYDEEEDERGWNPRGERRERSPRESYAVVVLDLTAGPPPFVNVLRHDEF